MSTVSLRSRELGVNRSCHPGRRATNPRLTSHVGSSRLASKVPQRLVTGAEAYSVRYFAQDFLAAIVTFALALGWLRLMDGLAARGMIEPRLSRKIIHIGTGPLFVLCWLLFSPSPAARFIAALVPLAITAQFVFVGLGWVRDENAVKAMTRSGIRREILRGPLFYGLVFVAFTLLFWRTTPIGIVALMILCAGDGLADVLGKRFGRTPLPYNRGKTLEGSAAMFLGGLATSVVMAMVFQAASIFLPPIGLAAIPAIALIALASTIVETLPLPDVDNLTVSATAAALGLLFF